MPAGNPPLTVRFHPLPVQEFTQNGVQTVRERHTMLVNLGAGPDDPPAKAGGFDIGAIGSDSHMAHVTLRINFDTVANVARGFSMRRQICLTGPTPSMKEWIDRLKNSKPCRLLSVFGSQVPYSLRQRCHVQS